MKTSLNEALNEALGALLEWAREGVQPKEARARLRRLAEGYQDIGMDVVWEEEAYGGTVHYDVLLHLSQGGTVSLGFCPDHGLPWPMRGAQRWREADLVRVNNTALTVPRAMACLDFIWNEARILERLVDLCLIQEALDQEPVHVSDEELQRRMDVFRQSHGLLTAEAAQRWMAERGLTQNLLEARLADEASIDLLRARVTGGRVEVHFAEHRADFDRDTLDEETRRAIEKLLFTAWLAERRQRANIEWYWGDVEQG